MSHTTLKTIISIKIPHYQMQKNYDIIIVGAGPAGCACAIELTKIHPTAKIALLEKHVFPRDKICGDALSPDVVNQIKILSPELFQQLHESKRAFPISGIKIGGRKNTSFFYRFAPNSKMQMYSCMRYDLDAMLSAYATSLQNIHFYDQCEVTGIKVTENGVFVESNRGQFGGQMIIGADGAHSVVGRILGRVPKDNNYHAGALRVYYENVSGLEEGMIELHYTDGILPGYFWIFPLPENKANVGMGMSSQKISEEKLSLRRIFQDIVENHPALRDRFLHAKPLENMKGFGLPLGGKRNDISGNRFLLLGDAASLIDPLTGEGIGNAIRSGRVAANHIGKSISTGNYSAKWNKAYDKEIYKRMMTEFKIDFLIRNIIQYAPASVDIFIWLFSRTSGVSTNLSNFLMWLHKNLSKI